MSRLTHRYTSSDSVDPHDPYQDWLKSFGWNIGITIQPSNPRYTADDMESLGSDVIYDLSAMLRVRSAPLVVFVREQSRGERLWHLHGLMHLKSNKRINWMIRHGEHWIRRCCDRFAERRGSRHSDPSIHLFNETSEGSDRWMDYINKESFRDPNGDRWIFGRPH
jgi:hypothetical protein